MKQIEGVNLMQNGMAKPYKGMGMEGFIAKWYTTTTRKGMKDFQALARQVAGELPPGSRVLEVAPGPGFFAIELGKLGNYRITGLDISKSFVEIAHRNAKQEHVEADFRLGNASQMPFEDESFDFLLCRAAFKNFSEPVRAVQEMYRVLKPGGRALIIDLRRDASWREINQQVDAMGLSWASTIMTKLTFRFMLLKRAYTKSEFEQFFTRPGFRSIDVQSSLTTLEVRAEK
jgi:ubiquinone/menaquinone biosynthesis C-methylase UbiE